MRQHLGAVDAAPAEGVVGQAVVFVPRDLGGHEVVHVAALHDLRQRGAVAKDVGQPQHARVDAQLLAEEALAEHKLPHQRLGPAQVAVHLDPRGAGGLPASLGDALLQPRVDGRLVLAHHLVEGRLAGHEVVGRVLLHEPQDRAEGAGALAPGLGHGPLPGQVDVGVSYCHDARLAPRMCPAGTAGLPLDAARRESGSGAKRRMSPVEALASQDLTCQRDGAQVVVGEEAPQVERAVGPLQCAQQPGALQRVGGHRQQRPM